MKDWRTTLAGVALAFATLFSGGKLNKDKIPEAIGMVVIGLTAKDANRKVIEEKREEEIKNLNK